MTIDEVAKVLAKVQLVDNREISQMVILEWHDILRDVDYDEAIAAVREHRRSSTEYLQPAHIFELAGVKPSPYDGWRDTSLEVLAESKARALEAAGVTEAEYEANQHDTAWVKARFDRSALGEGS